MSNIITEKHINSYTKDIDFSFLMNQWDIQYQKKRPDIQIEGSPERTSYRIVIEDDSCGLYILEMFSKERYQHKIIISTMLDGLKKSKVCFIQPYVKTITNELAAMYNHVYWQLIPYIPGESLKRPDYLHDDWRGKRTAEFLIDLWEKTTSMYVPESLKQFSLKAYVLNMMEIMKTHHPIQYQKLLPIINYIQEDFFKKYDTLPVRFCHGDYHSLNIIWSDHSINSVIDWEFLGIKSEIYDIANMLGCIGIEDPIGLFQDYAMIFLEEIKNSELIEKKSLQYLLECIIALRFGWLAEWLRKNDVEMIDLEITYMHLLATNKDLIKNKWHL